MGPDGSLRVPEKGLARGRLARRGLSGRSSSRLGDDSRATPRYFTESPPYQLDCHRSADIFKGGFATYWKDGL